MTRAALYARVSTADKGQDPETQLVPLREFAAAQGWVIAGEWVDLASAADLNARSAWRELLDACARRRVDLVVLWRMDRAFRSVLHAANTLERLRGWGVGLRSYSEPWLDTTSPFGEALYYITVAYAQLERGILGERTRAGLERARRQGWRLGRPGGTARPDFDQRWSIIRRMIETGGISQRAAAAALGVSRSTVGRLLQGGGRG